MRTEVMLYVIRLIRRCHLEQFLVDLGKFFGQGCKQTLVQLFHYKSPGALSQNVGFNLSNEEGAERFKVLLQDAGG
ncbi:hypothetical protein MJD09_04190 [bacterium]|nr:hypothetical protein [bacterium]